MAFLKDVIKVLINDRFDATEPTLSDHILDVLASFMCHKAKD